MMDLTDKLLSFYDRHPVITISLGVVTWLALMALSLYISYQVHELLHYLKQTVEELGSKPLRVSNIKLFYFLFAIF
jgi:hypothetical protein